MSRGGTAKRFDQEQIDDLEKQQTVSSTSVQHLFNICSTSVQHLFNISSTFV